MKTFPIAIDSQYKGPPFPGEIPWEIADQAYLIYASRYTGQSIEVIARRGGFYAAEMDLFLPDWRARCEKVIAIHADHERVIRDRDELRKIASELLDTFVHHGHPGEPCVQSGWVRVRDIADYRRRVSGA